MMRSISYIGIFLLIALPWSFHNTVWSLTASEDKPLRDAIWLAIINGTLVASTLIVVVEILFVADSPKLSPIRGGKLIRYIGMLLVLATMFLLMQTGKVVINGISIWQLDSQTALLQIAIFCVALCTAIFANFFAQNEVSR